MTFYHFHFNSSLIRCGYIRRKPCASTSAKRNHFHLEAVCWFDSTIHSSAIDLKAVFKMIRLFRCLRIEFIHRQFVDVRSVMNAFVHIVYYMWSLMSTDKIEARVYTRPIACLTQANSTQLILRACSVASVSCCGLHCWKFKYCYADDMELNKEDRVNRTSLLFYQPLRQQQQIY